MQCIFCRNDATQGKKIEHIVPESCGGGDWATLAPGIVCDKCNQYFGSKVESIAINDYPLNTIRLMNGGITKKRKWAAMDHYLGTIKASPFLNVIGIDPANENVDTAFQEDRISLILMIAETRNPLILCRLLLKIGLETIAWSKPDYALDDEYDDARRFARAPIKGTQWSFYFSGIHSVKPLYETDDIPFQCSVGEVRGVKLANTKVFGFTFVVPLTPNVKFEKSDSMPEPEFRFFDVTA